MAGQGAESRKDVAPALCRPGTGGTLFLEQPHPACHHPSVLAETCFHLQGQGSAFPRNRMSAGQAKHTRMNGTAGPCSSAQQAVPCQAFERRCPRCWVLVHPHSRPLQSDRRQRQPPRGRKVAGGLYPRSCLVPAQHAGPPVCLLDSCEGQAAMHCVLAARGCDSGCMQTCGLSTGQQGTVQGVCDSRRA